MDPIRQIAERRRALDQERQDHLRRITEIDKEIADQDTAIRVLRSLGLEPETEAPIGAEAAAYMDSERHVVVPSNSSLFRITLPIKDILLSVLRDAYPVGLNAAALRQAAQQKFQAHINPNTLTVSMSRHKEAGKVRIEGRDWFYVPENGNAGAGAPAFPVSRPGNPPGEPHGGKPSALRSVEPAPGGGT